MRNLESREFTPNDEIKEISPDLLKDVLISKEFHGKFSESIKSYGNKNREFGFTIIKDPKSSELWYGNVVGGLYDNETDLSKSANPIYKKLREENKDGHSFLTFHIHPFAYGEIVIPSITNGDLHDSNKDRLYTDPDTHQDIIMPSISLIATPNSRNINVLAYREPLSHDPFDLHDSMEQLEESMDYINNQDEVVRLLRQLGYSAEFMQADLNCRFDEESIGKFSKLAYKPIRLDE